MAYCEICNAEITKRDEQYIQIPGTDETHCVCAGCRASITTLTGEAKNTKLFKICAEEMASYLDSGQINENLKQYIISIMPDNATSEEEVEEWISSREEKEREQKRQLSEFQEQLNREEAIKRATFKLTTGYKFDGFEVTKYIKIVNGEVVIGGGMFREIAASASDVFGVQAGGFESNLGKAKNTALMKAKENAIAVGANALLGVDFDITTIGNSMLVVSVSGTAVKIAEQESTYHGTDQMS